MALALAGMRRRAKGANAACGIDAPARLRKFVIKDVVFIPKCRRKTLYVALRRHLGDVFRRLAEQKDNRIEEGHLMPDHVP